jgi:hypothetical protein
MKETSESDIESGWSTRNINNIIKKEESWKMAEKKDPKVKTKWEKLIVDIIENMSILAKFHLPVR